MPSRGTTVNGPHRAEAYGGQALHIKKNKNNQAFTVFTLFRLPMGLRNCTNQYPVVKGAYKMRGRKDGPCQRGF